MKYLIKGLRVGQGMKACDFAKKLGISHEYLRQIENGQAKNPNKQIKEHIAKLLNTNVDILFPNNVK